jgi:hypothetical protein
MGGGGRGILYLKNTGIVPDFSKELHEYGKTSTGAIVQ